MNVGWTEAQIGDVIALEYGKPLKKELRKPDGLYPVYGANGIKTRTDECYVDKPSIIVGRKGSAGEINLTEAKFWPLDVTYFVTYDDKKHELRFLYYLLNRLELPSLAKGVKPGINRNEVYSLVTKIPSKQEQQRIAGILDEAFSGIATAKANFEANLQNARALFESHLNAVFTQYGDGNAISARAEGELPTSVTSKQQSSATRAKKRSRRKTQTGGRDATTRHIPPKLALAVGMPKTPASMNWRWSALTNLARMESGHTPSRRHPEYWGGTVPWIGIKDARANHGRCINDTEQATNDLGLANSSARLLPENTVCLSRTASVGYVVIMGRPMATSQDFVNWVCSDGLLPDFLKYLFLAEGREGLLRYSSGAVHQTIYYPEAKGFHIAHPDTDEQERIVQQCDEVRKNAKHLESIYKRKLTALDELKKSLLHQAFSGQL